MAYTPKAWRFYSPCRHCGEWFDHKAEWRDGRPHYCSKECSRSAIRRYTYTCLRCGVEYHPKAKDRNKYCSRGCAFGDSKRRYNTDTRRRKKVARAYARHLKAGYRLAPCRQCGAPCRKTYCSERCTRTYWNDGDYHRECPTCGLHWCALLSGYGPSHYCSDECRDKGIGSIKRIRNAIKRAKVGDRIDPIRVFERDGWRCQACHCWTPRSLRGSYHNNAPELDHRVPISKGGEHTFDNVQTLCRICNVRKGNRDWSEFLKAYKKQ